jgi:hypothetical protein
MRKTSLCLLTVTVAFVVWWAGCSPVGTTADGPLNPVKLPDRGSWIVNLVNGEDGHCVDLLAGQTIYAGMVCFVVDGNNVLTVTYTTEGGWELTEAHFWAGCSSTGYPMTRQGNPIPGQFPYNSGDITGATTYTFLVDLNDPAFASCLGTIDCDNGNVFFAMSHAALRKDNGDGTYETQTGWGTGSRVVQRGNWATQSTLTLFDNSCNGGEPQCFASDTAFAYGDGVATCFLDIDEDGDGNGDFDRWGWSNGSLGAGTYTFDIYAGAGQCDLSKGTLVGTLSVSYDGSTATVTYTMASGFTMDDTHLYVGADILPSHCSGPNCGYTVAPGQFPMIHEGLNGASVDSYEIDGLSGPIYVVAHATVMVPVTCTQ